VPTEPNGTSAWYSLTLAQSAVDTTGRTSPRASGRSPRPRPDAGRPQPATEPRLLWALLAVLSRGRGPAAAQNGQGKIWRKVALFRGPKAPFSRAWSQGFSTQTINLGAFISDDFFGAGEQEKCRAPFSGEDSVDVTRTGRLRRAATNRWDPRQTQRCRQTASLPRRAVSLYLDASVYAGLRRHNRATH
jgi:hypothetical protein